MNNFVFPREFKEIKMKLSASAWDLSQKNKFLTTGFSGTNDTNILLPLNTVYESLSELDYTNGLILNSLLKPENNKYENLESIFNGEMILTKIKEEKVLLDVGALMSGLSNEAVARKWLSLNKTVDAAVYIDENDRLMVIGREQKRIMSFDLSPYKNRLEKCVIYLDDCHTRGTDLKFPADTRGIVTLGKSLTKDKLVQACMRLRLLGKDKGHYVSFLASAEVHQIISEKKQSNWQQTSYLLLMVLHIMVIKEYII